MTNPTADQIRAYLTATGWTISDSGPAGTLWVLDRPSHVRHGYRLGVPDDLDSYYSAEYLIERIAEVEKRIPADVRNGILDVDNPIHAQVRAAVISSMCERAAAIVHRQVADGSDDGFPGVWNADLAYAMSQQGAMLADVLEKTAAVIKAAAELDPSAPWHLWWTAARNAAAAIVQAEPSKPDNLEEIKRRLDAMRETKENEQ
jgi:hypothetical protein